MTFLAQDAQSPKPQNLPKEANDETYIPPVKQKLPTSVKKELIEKLKEKVEAFKGKLSPKQLKKFKIELLAQLRRYGVKNARKEVEDIMKGVNTKLLNKNLQGPYYGIMQDIKKQLKDKIYQLCKNVFEVDTKKKTDYCIQKNFDALVLNLILNLDTNHHSILAALQNEVYHGEKAAREFNIEDEQKKIKPENGDSGSSGQGGEEAGGEGEDF